jgi:NADP-dependent 3-hydroxy acid dehydrogenase YdfG
MKIEELFSVRGKVALVTGGSRGLGEMIARAYVENGAKVYITARRADACEALAKELSQIGECIAIPADLSRMEEIDRLSAELHKREKRLDILVNNAGASWGWKQQDRRTPIRGLSTSARSRASGHRISKPTHMPHRRQA